MALAQPAHRLTEAEYLEIERRAETRSEFHDGEMFAMSGGALSHSLIKHNLNRELGNALKDSPCLVLDSDMRIKVQSAGLYTYPDLSVGCGQLEFQNERKETLLNPSLIIEVLSDSTEAYDRGKKFEFYRQLPSLREYLLVNQHKPLIEQFIKQDSGEWLLRDVAGLGNKLFLTSLTITIEMVEVYRNIQFEQPEKSSQPPQ